MGSHKHGTSGHPPRSPRYKLMQTLEANREAEEERAKRPKGKTFETVGELLGRGRR